ncbi:uncharacterized protein NPIL_82761 [Nephila pilipes]|uniref:Uncharacterized protein n=1 Tax=Nephila pilipes TaxID=299642 RepID=A0A8X6TWR9_NEPPI|nr:uncharacterized protein NPIL_82761 [Nephila pilipes]
MRNYRRSGHVTSQRALSRSTGKYQSSVFQRLPYAQHVRYSYRMKIHRKASIFILAVVSIVCVSSTFFKKNNDEDGLFGLLPRPKPFTLFSRPDKDSDKINSSGIITHIGNVLQGGTIGVQFETRPLGVLGGILGHAKKIIPGGDGKEVVGYPSNEKLPAEKDPWKGDKDLIAEEPDEKEWEIQKPGKPARLSWDDIGEDPEGYSTEIPIEDVIQPRLRPKRFIESKIYHVPLTYRSNGRPYRVNIKNRNELVDSKPSNI